MLTTPARATMIFRIGAVLCALAIVTTFASPPATAAPSAIPIGLLAGSQYVALGDSYSAGFGLPSPPPTQPAVGCAQSSLNYPHQIAATFGLTLTDNTCTGAVTANIDQTPQVTSQPGGGTAPLQDSSLGPATRLVTVTIGGNDLLFAAIAQACVAQTATGPLLLQSSFANCTAYLPTTTNPVLNPTVNRPTVVTALNRVMGDIKNKAPNAKIFVLEYPTIAPPLASVPPAGCFRKLTVESDAFPFTVTDVPYLNSVEADLNAAVDRAATTIGATVVATFTQTANHSACASGADQWLNGILVGDSVFSPLPGGLHPNRTGVNFMATQATRAIGRTFPVVTPAPTTTSVTPTSPSAAATARPGPAGTGSRPTASLWWILLGLLLVGGLLVLTVRWRRTRSPTRHR